MRVAVWIYGGIGGGNFSQGVPHLTRLIEKLSLKNEVTIYSILPANKDFIPKGYSFRTINRKISFLKIRMLLLAILFLYDHILKPYDLLHAFWGYPAGTFAVVLGKITRLPSLVGLQGGEGANLPAIPYGNMTNKRVRKITLWTCENATTLISISKFLSNKMTEHGLKRKDVKLIPYGADVELFRPQEKNKGVQLKIIHVANLNQVKDQSTLLKTFAKIMKQQSSLLRIIGDGILFDELQLQTKELGITDYVEFVGAIPNAQLSQHYYWADMMLHTSVYEGQAVVVCEALASKVVVCGTRVGIMADFADECCCVSEVGDDETLAQNVLSLWNNSFEFKRLQENGLAWAQQHTLAWSANEIQNVYDTLTKNKL